MEPEAQKILKCFENRGMKTGDYIDFCDFGDAMVWGEGGSIKDESTREAVGFLIENGFVLEASAGLELAEKGCGYLTEKESGGSI